MEILGDFFLRNVFYLLEELGHSNTTSLSHTALYWKAAGKKVGEEQESTFYCH